MNKAARFRGPRLGTKLILMGLVLLSIPWLGYRYLLETKNFLLEGQAQAQLLTAKGIAITLQSNDKLFNDLPLNIEDYETLTSYPLDYPIRIDGYNDDWRDLRQHQRSFGGRQTSTTAIQTGTKFNLLLGVSAQYLYAYLDILDNTKVYRHPGYRRLDNSDHLRLNFIDAEGQSKRLLLTMEGPGNMTAYYVDADWFYAVAGQPEYEVASYVRDTERGYEIELRIPLAMLGPQKRLGLSYADVDNPELRQVQSLTSTLPSLAGAKTNLILLRSPAIEKIITELNQADAQIWILDQQRRVRATAGQLQIPSDDESPPYEEDNQSGSLWSVLVDLLFQKLISSAAADFKDFDPRLTSQRDDQVITQALIGKGSSRRRASLDGRAQIITAAYPISEQDQIIGAVVLEQSTESVLALQRQALENIVMLTALSLLAIVLVVILFSLRLAYRVRRMRKEAALAIDPHGRLMVDQLEHETTAGDEIGDLARSVSSMLTRLHQYQQFVANIPRTLRHEVNNPLNTISTSLENLAHETDESQRQLYLERAKRGLRQMSILVQQLAESASLEQSLASDEMERVDLSSLLRQYLSNYQSNHPELLLEVELDDSPTWINCADFRIEQLLDKLLDNAADFSASENPLSITLHKTKGLVDITIANQGRTIDESQIPLIFNLMSSSRPAIDAEKPHLGLGLYISKLIVDYHNGSIQISNLPDQSGVVVHISLPLSKE